MVTGTLRRTANGYVVDVPREEVEQSGLHDGQTVVVTAPVVEAHEGASADEAAERQAWRQLALRSLEREWDNEANAACDQLSNGHCGSKVLRTPAARVGSS